jgi:hypothetical protein
LRNRVCRREWRREISRAKECEENRRAEEAAGRNQRQRERDSADTQSREDEATGMEGWGTMMTAAAARAAQTLDAMLPRSSVPGMQGGALVLPRPGSEYYR